MMKAQTTVQIRTTGLKNVVRGVHVLGLGGALGIFVRTVIRRRMAAGELDIPPPHVPRPRRARIVLSVPRVLPIKCAMAACVERTMSKKNRRSGAGKRKLILRVPRSLTMPRKGHGTRRKPHGKMRRERGMMRRMRMRK